MPATYDKLTTKTRKIKTLVEHGMNIEEAYALVQPNKKVTRQSKHAMKKKLEALQLAEPKRVNKAIRAIENTLEGKTTGDIEKVTTGEVLTAAKMVLDRAEPIININKNLNINADISPVNLDKYRTN